MLYALRDVTATVDNVSLIAASIMSKKIAAGADAIVLDVKVGDGAFMKSLSDAQVLGEAMLALGQRAGRDVVCVLTDMDQPLGCAVGNALEVREAVATLRGEGPADFTELVLDASAHLLALSDLGVDRAEARAARGAGGRRRHRPRPRTSAGCARRTATPTRRPCPPRRSSTRSRRRAAATSAGSQRFRSGSRRSTSAPGGARRTTRIDHAVGIVCRAKRGDAVAEGDTLAEVHAHDDRSAREAAADVLAAYELVDEPPRARPIILDTLV